MTSQSTKKSQSSNPVIRRKQPIIFWIFLLVAIPATIIVGLYSAGYRYNAENHTLSRTAAISLISTPKRATVTLNGATQSQTTPFIQTAPAGTYHMTVTKDGYQTWEKRMNIVPGKSIVFSEIVLFYKEPIVKTVSNSDVARTFSFEFGRIETVSNLATTESEDVVVLKEKGFANLEELRVIRGGSKTLLVDTKNDRTYILNSLKDEIYNTWIDGAVSDVEWVEKNSFVYATGTDVWLYRVDTKNMDLIVRGSQAVTSLGVHYSGQYFYYTTESGVYAVEYDSRDKRQIWTLKTGPNMFIESVKNNGRIIILSDTQDASVSTKNQMSLELYEQDTLLP